MKDEVKFLNYLHDHHFKCVFIATLCLLFLVTFDISCIKFLNLIVFRLMIIVVKTILTFFY